MICIFQQDDALFSDVLRIVTPLERIDHAANRRIVDDTCGKHAAKDAMDHIVEPRLGNLPVFYRLLQRLAEVVVIARHVLIHPVQRGLHRAMRSAPVRQYPALELEVLFQNLVQQVVVLAGMIALVKVVGTHHT